MICKKCGCRVNDTATFCDKCGASMAEFGQKEGTVESVNIKKRRILNLIRILRNIKIGCIASKNSSCSCCVDFVLRTFRFSKNTAGVCN